MSADYDELVAELTATSPAADGKMFGMRCLTVQRKGFAGLWNGSLVCKLAQGEHAQALALEGAELFDPMGSRPMKEWVVIPGAHADQWPHFARAAMSYVQSKLG